MQIGFFDRHSVTLEGHVKGQLFESFVRGVVQKLGYTDIELRVKRNGLEFDLRATHVATHRRLLGEAKALERTVRAQELTGFVGKVLPEADGNLDALFVSVSPTAPEAEAYLADPKTVGLLTRLGCSFRRLAGNELATVALEANRSASEEALRSRVEQTELVAFEPWLIVSDGGWIVAVPAGTDPVSGPSCVALFTAEGQWLETDRGLLDDIARQVPSLGELSLLPPSGSSDDLVRDDAAPLPGILVGSGWFDYRFPAPPDYFIGRQKAIGQIEGLARAVARRETSLRVVQVLSRSGVGKSSLLVQLPSKLMDGLLASVLVDARAMRTPLAVQQVAAQLVDSVNEQHRQSHSLPGGRADLIPALRRACESCEPGQVALVGIDQFESLLAVPSVFEAFLDVVVQATEESLPIVWVLARKNDLTATFDTSSKVDLGRLNELSEIVQLGDFDQPEAEVLIGALGASVKGRLRSDLKESVLTFSGGFPWLLKRVCAHIVKLLESGTSQLELAQAGLRAEDLFEEDLAGLSEQDKAVLKSLAGHLPATGTELSNRLEGELGSALLTARLGDFLARRLIRLSGDVYDTYNDVFKTYLLAGRVPFRSRYVLRLTPESARRLLEEIMGQSSAISIDELHLLVSGNRNALLNKLRDLRVLGLVEVSNSVVTLPDGVRAAIEGDRLGRHLRASLLANELVTGIHGMLLGEDHIEKSRIAAYLADELPHVDAKPSTWDHYANIMVAWLRYSGVVATEGGRVRLRAVHGDDVEQRSFSKATFEADTFMPSTRPQQMADFLSDLKSHGPSSVIEVGGRYGKRAGTLIRDATSLGIIQVSGPDVILTPTGRAVGSEGRVTAADLAAVALVKPNLTALIEAARSDGPLSGDAQREVIQRFGVGAWTELTWRWRLGILRSWLVATGQARAGRRGLSWVSGAASQPAMPLAGSSRDDSQDEGVAP